MDDDLFLRTSGNTYRPVTKVGLIGFGTVGQSVARILLDSREQQIDLVSICNRNVDRKRVDWVPDHVVWTSNFDDILNSDADIVVELIGGTQPATDFIREALEHGKSVVTANKQVIAHSGGTLSQIAFKNNCRVLFEAAVGGVIPVIRGVQEGLTGDTLTRIHGLLNGTCNYILTRMENGRISFDQALSEAQELGFAEADPAADIDGDDAQAKIAILSAIGLGYPLTLESIPTSTIRGIDTIDFVYADRLHCTIRQVSRVERSPDENRVISASVQLMLVPNGSPLARAEGSQNVVVVDGERSGETAFSGFGAGGDPTAVAVVSDVIAISHNDSRVVNRPVQIPSLSVQTDFDSAHYIRLVVVDRPGIISELARIFATHDINIDSLLQEPGWSKTELPFVITLERCNTSAVRNALSEIHRFDFHARDPFWMPILARGET